MIPVSTSVLDPAEFPETNEQIAAYLDDIFRNGDPELIVAAIADVARARGMSKLADYVNYGYESPQRSLSQDYSPSFETIIKVLATLGFSLRLALDP